MCSFCMSHNILEQILARVIANDKNTHTLLVPASYMNISHFTWGDDIIEHPGEWCLYCLLVQGTSSLLLSLIYGTSNTIRRRTFLIIPSKYLCHSIWTFVEFFTKLFFSLLVIKMCSHCVCCFCWFCMKTAFPVFRNPVTWCLVDLTTKSSDIHHLFGVFAWFCIGSCYRLEMPI